MILLLAAIPLYLLKIEMIPREAAWLPSLVFVAFLAPARLLTGWAYARSGRRDRPSHWAFRILGRLAIIPVAAFYVLIVFLAQYTSWGGAASPLRPARLPPARARSSRCNPDVAPPLSMQNASPTLPGSPRSTAEDVTAKNALNALSHSGRGGYNHWLSGSVVTAVGSPCDPDVFL